MPDSPRTQPSLFGTTTFISSHAILNWTMPCSAGVRDMSITSPLTSSCFDPSSGFGRSANSSAVINCVMTADMLRSFPNADEENPVRRGL